MEVSSQFYDLSTSPLKTVPSTQSIGGWDSPSIGLDVMQNRNLALLGTEPGFLSCPAHSLNMTLYYNSFCYGVCFHGYISFIQTCTEIHIFILDMIFLCHQTQFGCNKYSLCQFFMLLQTITLTENRNIIL